MKFRKLISTMLTLAMLLSVLSVALPVSAADTANVTIVAVDAEGEAVDFTALEVGDTFVAQVWLKDIAEQKFYSAQAAVYYDPAVLQPVNAAGNAVTTAAAFVARPTDMYNEDEGTGYFQRVSSSIDSAKGLAEYALGMVTDAPQEIKDNGFAVASGEFMVYGIRFKVLAKDVDSKLQIADADAPEQTALTAGVKAFLGSGSSLATVSVVKPSFYVGIKYLDITAVQTLASEEVWLGTSKADVIAQLPTTVDVTYDDSTSGTAEVTWDCADYDADVATDYNFVGTLATSATVTNTQNKTAAVQVTVKKPNITAVDAIADVNVPNGTLATDLAALLPSTVSVTLENSATKVLPVVWGEPTGYDPATAGTYAAEGTLTLDGTVLNGSDVKAAVNVIVADPLPADATAKEDEEVAYTVPYASAASDVIAGLPGTVLVTLEGDIETPVAVTWEAPANYDPNVAGDYIFTAVCNTTGIDFGEYSITATVTVAPMVGIRKITAVAPVGDASLSVAYGTNLASVKTQLPAQYTATLEDGTPVTLNTGAWTCTSYRPDTAGTYNFTANLVIDATVIDANGFGVVTFPVTVEDAGLVPATSVVILRNGLDVTDTVISARVGRNFYLEADVLPWNATDTTVTWSTASPYKASIEANGLVRPKATGRVVITATAANGVYATVTLSITGGGGSSLISAGTVTPGADGVEIAFTDLADFTWAARQISELAAAEIVAGKSETDFAPADAVTRAEFAAMLGRAMGFKSKVGAQSFTDVSADDWFAEAVAIASANGFVSGYENGAFDPNKTITREEMASMALRAAQAKGLLLTGTKEVSFTDANRIQAYAQDAVNILAKAGVINGMEDGRFAPAETANRAQAAVIIYNLWDLM